MEGHHYMGEDGLEEENEDDEEEDERVTVFFI